MTPIAKRLAFSAATFALLAGGLILPDAARAQSGYSAWTDPDAAKEAAARAEGLVEELDKLVSEAEKARAADPAFLRDLRDLIRRYDNPWQALLLQETFADGDFTANPAWEVASGRWWVERGYGLRSESQAAAASSGQESDGGDRNREAAKRLLGAILNQALNRDGNSQSGSGGDAGPAVITLAQQIPNAFMLKVELTSWQPTGSFALGTWQGTARQAGYRLVYRPGERPVMELVRVTSRGTSIVDSTPLSQGLEDRKTHVVEWSRDGAGAMKVMLDGAQVLAASDRGFRDPFGGLLAESTGGSDIMLARIEAYGAQ